MPKKIFEIAKELDMGAIDLVEKLKSEGFSVRNHMTSLTDEEVEKVMALMAPAPAPEKKKKKTKKKVTKKKTTKKKVTVVKKTSASEEAPAQEEVKAESKGEDVGVESDTSAKSSTVRKKKKAVIRKKSGSDEESETKVPEKMESQSLGLRVVSKPEKVQVASTEEASTTPDEGPSSPAQKELYKEKVHTFTPVFIPEAGAESTSSTEESGATSTESSGEDANSSSGPSNKRIGGLATMMSGKKPNMNKAQVLNQERADTELKSYQALSGTGRPLYTQVKRKRAYSGPTKETNITEVKESKRIVKMSGGGTVDQLAKKLKVKLKALADQALDLNLLIKSGDYVGIKLADQLAQLFEYRVEDTSFNEEEMLGKEKLSDEEKQKLPLRNPIITIMGHVDHGKTTLLDYIRNAKVADGEAGGITQHIGAYSVKVKEKTLTFLDTPGHAAFANMRQRGADVTDIVVLVVAADDGVMPQTKESVRFCQESGVPIIVAVNKMDKEESNPDRVKTELAEFSITPEEWGGDTQFVPISALKGDGVDDLLESIALQAEMMELRADDKGILEGVVIESKIEQGRGPVSTILIQQGTLKKGDSIVVGETFGRARSLTDSLGKDLKSAGPSMPVQILGLSDAPSPGEMLNKVKNEREAKKIVENRIDERKKLESVPEKKTVSLEDFFAQATGPGVGEKRSLNLIIRTDVQGSFEAIKQSLLPMGTNSVEVKIIGGGVGPISDSDVQLASSAEGIIIGFNMRPISTARRIAEEQGVDIKTYSIIYEVINDVKLALEGLLDPEFIEEFIGRSEIKETFVVPKIGTIAGCLVTDGKIQVGCNIRLLREGKILHDGKLSSLKRFKDDVKEVKNGFECGMGLENYNDLKVGDVFEAYLMQEKKRSLEDVKKEEEADARQKEKEKAEAEENFDQSHA